LDELDLISSESSQVGDIKDTIVSFGMLTMDSSDLNMILIGDRLMEFWVGHQFWEVNMHGSSKTGSKVSWAVRDITEMLIIGELSLLLNLCSCDR
jgi:hypothetical protein